MHEFEPMRPHPRASVLAAAATVVLVAAAGMIFAPWSLGTNDVPISAQALVQRSVVWVGYPSQDPHSFRISSLSVGAPVTDAFQIAYGDGGFTLEYQKNASRPATLQYALTLRNLVEWNDTNGNGMIDNESIVETFALGDTGFGAVPIRHSQTASPDGGAIHSFEISSNNGEVVLNLTISERFVQLSAQQTLTPMEAKLTVSIDHTLVHPGARLALQVGLETTTRPALENTSWDDEHNFSTDNHQIEMSETAGPNAGAVFFAWSNQAAVNARPAQVSITGPEPEDTVPNYYDMYLAYPAEGNLPSGTVVRVVHDPMMGVVSAAYASLANLPPPPGLRADTTLYVVSLTAVAAAVLASVVLVSRRRRSK